MIHVYVWMYPWIVCETLWNPVKPNMGYLDNLCCQYSRPPVSVGTSMPCSYPLIFAMLPQCLWVQFSAKRCLDGENGTICKWWNFCNPEAPGIKDSRKWRNWWLFLTLAPPHWYCRCRWSSIYLYQNCYISVNKSGWLCRTPCQKSALKRSSFADQRWKVEISKIKKVLSTKKNNSTRCVIALTSCWSILPPLHQHTHNIW